MQQWKAYWIMRAVEKYLVLRDPIACAMVTHIVNEFERNMSRSKECDCPYGVNMSEFHSKHCALFN